jgi:hypothetical protein
MVCVVPTPLLCATPHAWFACLLAEQMFGDMKSLKDSTKRALVMVRAVLALLSVLWRRGWLRGGCLAGAVNGEVRRAVLGGEW